MPRGCHKAITYTILGFLAMTFLCVGMTLARVIFGGIADIWFVLIVLLLALIWRIYMLFFYQRPKQKRKRIES